jgi:hypothetical protein
MKAKLIGAGIAAALAVAGIGTAVAGAAALDQTTTTQRSTVVDRGGRGFIQDEQSQQGFDCPERDGTTPEASPGGTTSSDV